jgi:glycosyltransferase involved in cell wall biosynthesis
MTPEITIIVKALNEERHIEACLRSALAALQGFEGEVVLADSVSTDRTVEIARRLDVRIVQFASAADRGCGAALQLGYQFARGRFIYVLDGDMELDAAFLRRAHQYLLAHPAVAGVGGRLVDTQLNTLADKLRARQYAGLAPEQQVAVLGGGGLYRRAAIEQVGYLANRWLSAFEEAELGVRLRAAGYSLVRLSDAAVSHSGHNEDSLQMLLRLWRNRRIQASGVFLRGALGQAWLADALRLCWFVFAAPALYAAAALLAVLARLAGAGAPAAAGAGLLLAWGGSWLLLAWRKRDGREALLALLAWHLYFAGALRGFMRPAPDPKMAISARILADR